MEIFYEGKVAEDYKLNRSFLMPAWYKEPTFHLRWRRAHSTEPALIRHLHRDTHEYVVLEQRHKWTPVDKDSPPHEDTWEAVDAFWDVPDGP